VCTGTPDGGSDAGADADAGDDGGAEADAPACPIRGCATGSEDRYGCSGARTIGRREAGAAAGYVIDDSTCYEYDEMDEGGSDCWDAGGDHTYRMFVRAGESVRIDLSIDWGCVDAWWDSTLKVYSNSGCDDTSCATRVYCEEYISSSHTASLTAPRDGWYILVVDGTTAFDDEGDYRLTVHLTCLVPGCEC
jgi:hypothetical protein